MHRNGNMALMSSLMGISKACLITNRFNPIGGVIIPISLFTVINTPNQIRSNPRPETSGIKKGRVSRIMVSTSTKHPRKIRRIFIAIIIDHFDNPELR